MATLDHVMMVIASVWFVGLGLYLAVRLSTCLTGTVDQQLRARAAFRGELRMRGLLALAATLKITAIAIPRVQHHAPWLWVVPLAVLALRPLIGVWKNRPRSTRYTRALRMDERNALAMLANDNKGGRPKKRKPAG